MSFLGTMKAERLISDIKASGDPTSASARKALSKLAGMGNAAVEPIIEALSTSDKQETLAYVEVLTALVDAKTIPLLAKGLSESNPRAIAGIAWALSGSKNYPPSVLLDLLAQEGVSKPAILDVITAQKSRFTVRELLTAAYAQEPNEKAALFRVVGEIADESSVPDLLARVDGKDPVARMHIINILGRFNQPAVSHAIQNQLKDPNKLIRQAALLALTRLDGPIEIQHVCQLLRDPEIDVQNKAVDVVIKANHPETTRYLVDVLKDENEYARRAAVEVLNEIGTPKSVKYLLEAIKDDDWWVRSRAADALGKIGGPKVVDAVLALIRDEDEDIRRSAIEILNQTKDERAVSHLIEATKDPDWWVSERAVDALAEIGSKRAVPRLTEMLQASQPRSVPVALRALAKLGDHKVIEPVLQALSRPEKEIRVEAMNVLAKVADERRVEQIRVQLQSQQANNSDPTVQQAAARALQEIDNRYSTSVVAAGRKAEQFAAEPAKTLLMLKAEAEGITPQQLIAHVAAERPQYLEGFHLSFDNWHSTDSPENTALSQDIYRKLKSAGLIYSKAVEQFFDPVKGMFLPDRYIKGECPNCHSKDQYGDACEVCSTVYAPTDLIDPYSTLSGAKPVLKTSDHLFFRLSDPKCVEFLNQWIGTSGRLQAQVANKAREWLDGRGERALGDWDISRDAPYFGIPIPDLPGKYFYVWLDAPIGYLASLKHYFDSGKAAARGERRSFTEFLVAPDTEQVHFIGKDIIYFHTLFWPAMLRFAGSPYRVPDHVYVHAVIDDPRLN